MSQTFSLVCHETKQRIWIGQGHGVMRSLYYGERHTMENLKRFLNEHIGKPLVLMCNDTTDGIWEYRAWEDLPIPELGLRCDHGNEDGDGTCTDCGMTVSEQHAKESKPTVLISPGFTDEQIAAARKLVGWDSTL